MRIYVEGIGLRGPGLDGWAASRPILAGEHEHVPTPTRLPPTELLPPNERRRAAQTVRLALAVGAEAFAVAGRDPADAVAVFTSSGGDGETIHEILSVLASSNRELSPTRFHNSVHNTPAGYWGIGTGSRGASSSLCCHDDSFAAGLLEAAAQAIVEKCPVALIAYDVQYPAPLCEVRAIGAPFAAALLLESTPTAAAIARIDLRVEGPSRTASDIASPSLKALRWNTPAARSLPLLAALARETEAVVTLHYLEEMELALHVRPIAFGEAPAVGQSERMRG